MSGSRASVALSAANLEEIAARGVAVPSYDRSAVTAGIVHLGVGAFHRVHEAVYTDDLLAAGETAWGICGVGVLPQDAAMAEALRAQDHLYTVVEKSGDDVTARVVGSIVDYLLAPQDPDAVVARIAHPDTRIVSMTITEGGYSVNESTGSFDPTPQVLADLQPGATPSTAFGLVVAGLARRREAGVGGLTVLSCDNLPGNGDLAKLAFCAFAERLDGELAAWMRTHVAFPNTMVDRIAPVTTDADRDLLRDTFGVVDRWPAVCEPFRMWVLQEAFAPTGRPAWEDVGATIAEDVRPYELMKLGLLNSAHQALAYFGHLLGHVYADQAATDPDIAALVTRYLAEATPAIPRADGMDLEGFRDALLPRFSNAAIGDTVARLAAFSSDRIPQWLVPVIRENLAAGRPVPFAAAIVASWARYAEGVDEQGNPIDAVDNRWEERHAAALAQAQDPLAFVRARSMFGDLADRPEFTEPYLAALTTLRTEGARACLTQVLAG